MKKSDIEIDVDSIAALCDCLDLNPFEITLAQIDILNLSKKRYGKIQRQKTDNTLFLEAQLFKNRMLTLYKALEDKVITDNKISGIEKAKCAYSHKGKNCHSKNTVVNEGLNLEHLKPEIKAKLFY